MLGIHDFGLFLVAGVLLNLTPGQDTLYIVGRSVAQGRAIGVASALGISAGCLLHTLAAALGLSALLAASPSAFFGMQLIGAAYLIYLGARMLLTRTTEAPAAHVGDSANWFRAFSQGALTNITNPKVALFFLAFLPQFIHAASPHKFAAMLLLGLTFVVTGTLWCLILALGAARLRERVATNSRVTRLLTKIAGALFIALGLRLAATNT